MSGIVGIILNLETQSIDECIRFYKDMLSFTDVLEKQEGSHYEIIFHNAALSKSLFLRIRQTSYEKHIKPSQDHLIIFYLSNKDAYTELVDKLSRSGVKQVKSLNPYWDKVGKTFLGPDNYRIVICPGDYMDFKARVARPSSDLAKVERFYRGTLSFDKLAEFKDHEGFDGIMLSMDNIDCHFEMTYQHGHDKHEVPPSGYGLEFLCQSELDMVNAHVDADGYTVIMNSQKTFINRYLYELATKNQKLLRS